MDRVEFDVCVAKVKRTQFENSDDVTDPVELVAVLVEIQQNYPEFGWVVMDTGDVVCYAYDEVSHKLYWALVGRVPMRGAVCLI